MNEEVLEVRNKLNGEQKRALRQSWARLKGHTGLRKAVDLLFTVFNRTIETESRASPLFTQTAFLHTVKHDPGCTVLTVHDHANFMAHFLDYVIEYSSHSSDFGDEKFYLSYIGGVHAKLKESGFDGAFFEKFGQVFAEVFVAQVQIKTVPHAKKVWIILSAILTDKFRSGFDNQVREVKKQTKETKKLYSSGSIPHEPNSSPFARPRVHSWAPQAQEYDAEQEEKKYRSNSVNYPANYMTKSYPPALLVTESFDDDDGPPDVEMGPGTSHQFLRHRHSDSSAQLGLEEEIEIERRTHSTSHLLLPGPGHPRRRLPTSPGGACTLTVPSATSPVGQPPRRRSLPPTPK